MAQSNFRWIGIDFSGNRLSWAPRTAKSNVWIAELRDTGTTLNLTQLYRIQALPGLDHPFSRLVSFLKDGKFDAAAIDAPFSIPCEHPNDRQQLIQNLCHQTGNRRPFVAGEYLVRTAHLEGPYGQKPYRETEEYYRKNKINVRSALWNGPRGGAPFAVACLTLIGLVQARCWPWEEYEQGVLVEAFPAAQLRQWGLHYTGYGKPSQGERRSEIVRGIKSHFQTLELTKEQEHTLSENPDALDAFVCCFAARAVGLNLLALPPPTPMPFDGWIAVHRTPAP